MALNIVALEGRLTADPDLKNTQSGIAVCSFSLAVDRNYKSGEEKKADFINCVAWRGTAEFLSKYFHKGDGVTLTGSIQTRSWDDDHGNKRYATEVLVGQLYFPLGKKGTGNDSGGAPAYGKPNISANNDAAYRAPAPQASVENLFDSARNAGVPTSAGANFEEILTDEDLPF